jgi:serine/threonine protein phosphatase PrpC
MAALFGEEKESAETVTRTGNIKFTDKGKFRGINHDAIWIGQADQDGKIISTGAFFDGIGGLERGEIASKTLALELKINNKSIQMC